MLSAKAIAVPALHGGSYRFGIWQIGSQAKYTLTSTSLARASIDQEANKLPAVIASSQQQALDQARQVLLKKRKTDPQYATLPAFLGGTVSVDSLKQKLFTDTVLNQIDPIAMQVLQQLVPDLSGCWHKLQPEILLAMTADTSAVASKLLQLKMWFPQANVSMMVAQRPTLVLDNEFNGIPAAMGVLQHWFEADAIDHMVQEQPLFLIEDVEDAISSLNRWMSTTNGAHKLQRNPQLLLSLVPNRKLSLW